MRNLLRRFERSSVDRAQTAPTWGVAGASDPTTWIEAFDSHWQQAQSIMRACERAVITEEHIVTVFKHLDQMAFLLLTEINAQPIPSIGAIMDKYFMDEIMMTALQFCLRAPGHLQKQAQINMLKLYESLVTQAHTHHSLLVHKPILVPLLRLLEWCQRTTLSAPVRSAGPSEVEKHFVLLLYQVCIKISEHTTLLEFFFNATTAEDTGRVIGTDLSRTDTGSSAEPPGTPRFLVFTLLIPYLYEQGDIGQLARDAILLILSVSRSSERVGAFIGEHCSFCPILATGLSGCFSQLPRRLTATLNVSDDWRRITPSDIDALPALSEFHAALLFVNAVVQMFQIGHKQVLRQLMEFIYNGFLLSVVRPALFENGLEELVSATAYLELCFRTVSESALQRVFLRFIIVESEGEKKILDSLVDRISSTTKLCLVSLALFDTLLSLYCEDLLIELVLKYLIPCTHVMGSQIGHVGEIDMTGAVTNKLLCLVPRCCPLDYHLTTSNSSADLESSNEPAPSLSSFYDYLDSARDRVQQSYLATRCWAMSYDGRVPDPYQFRDGALSDGEGPNSATVSHSEAESSTGFRRVNALRGSSRRFNSYFTRRHTSMATASGLEPSGVDLSVLGPDFMNFSDGDEDDMDFIDRLLMAAHESDAESTAATPRYRKEAPDYFKLAYDEPESSDAESNKSRSAQPRTESITSEGATGDAVPPSASASLSTDGNITDASLSTVANIKATATAADQFVLRGWSELEDLDAFIETLGTVRASHESHKYTLEENMQFIDDRLAQINQELDPQPVPGTDSGLGSSMVVPPINVGPMDGSEMNKSKQDDETDGGGLAELYIGVPIECAESLLTPCLGPFLNHLLTKLDMFLDNGLFINLQLTGVLTRLACHTQPLIASLFFNHSLVFQPSVKSIWQILSATTQKIDALAFAADGFSLLLQRGWKYLLSRDRRYTKEMQKQMKPRALAPSPVPFLENQGSTFTAPDDRPRSISDMFVTPAGGRNPKIKDRAESDTTGITGDVEGNGGALQAIGRSYRFHHHKAFEQQSATLDTMRTKNVVYCAIVLREFLQELAAISLEQTAVRGYVDVTKYL